MGRRFHSLAAGACALLMVSQLDNALAQDAEEGGREISLEQAIAMARRNPRVELAEQKTREAQARKREADGARFPRLQGEAFLGPSPEIRCVESSCTTTDPSEASLALSGLFAGASLTVVQPLFTSGKIFSARAAARHAVAMSRAQTAIVADDQLIEVAQAYYGAKLALDLLDMLEEGREDIADAQEQVDAKLEEGSGELDLQDEFRLAVLQAEVDSRIAEAQQELETALFGLRALVGDQEISPESEPLSLVERDLQSSSGAYEATLKNRPEMQAVRSARRAARALVDFESAGFWPDLALAAELKVARAQGVDDPPSAFANDPYNKDSAAVGLVLRWNLDLLAQRARRDRARARAHQAEKLSAIVVEKTRFDLRRAYARARQSRVRHEASARGAKSARGWVISVLQGQMLGLTRSKDLADAYVAYFTMRARNLQAIHDWNLAVLELDRAAGQIK